MLSQRFERTDHTIWNYCRRSEHLDTPSPGQTRDQHRQKVVDVGTASVYNSSLDIHKSPFEARPAVSGSRGALPRSNHQYFMSS